MFCSQCGERFWTGRTSCHKCGADAPTAASGAAAAPECSRSALAFRLAATFAACFTLGAWASRSYHDRSPRELVTEPEATITPLNFRDPSSLVMGPFVPPPPVPPPAVRAGTMSDPAPSPKKKAR
jgi:hypothetical protein